MGLVANVTVRRGAFDVAAELSVEDGQTVALLGPNGAGKTTVIEAIAGLVPLTGGSVQIDGHDVSDLPPERRAIGVAFQDALLFEQMTVRENVAFPMRARRQPAATARARADELLARVAPGVDPGIGADRISGGERQRVALARALAAEPRVLLLDEPLAAVDVGARAELRQLLRREIQGFDGPCLLIAHDPVDALTLADEVVILEVGRVVQRGSPAEIRREPRSPYAADLVGVNLFVGRLVPAEPGAGRLETAEGAITVAWPEGLPAEPIDDVLATVRPADVALHAEAPEGSARNVLSGEVVEVAVAGERGRVRLASAPPVVAEITLGSVARMGVRPGVPLFASFKAVEVRLLVGAGRPDTL
jgi:molybdate transport system ATP-binding protein